MDLRVYYSKVREVEAAIKDPDVIVVSLETPEGGAAGVRSEVRRSVAARLVVGRKARLATAEESAEYRAQVREAVKAAEQKAAAQRMQITVLSEADLRAIREAGKMRAGD